MVRGTTRALALARVGWGTGTAAPPKPKPKARRQSGGGGLRMSQSEPRATQRAVVAAGAPKKPAPKKAAPKRHSHAAPAPSESPSPSPSPSPFQALLDRAVAGGQELSKAEIERHAAFPIAAAEDVEALQRCLRAQTACNGAGIASLNKVLAEMARSGPSLQLLLDAGVARDMPQVRARSVGCGAVGLCRCVAGCVAGSPRAGLLLCLPPPAQPDTPGFGFGVGAWMARACAAPTQMLHAVSAPKNGGQDEVKAATTALDVLRVIRLFVRVRARPPSPSPARVVAFSALLVRRQCAPCGIAMRFLTPPSLLCVCPTHRLGRAALCGRRPPAPHPLPTRCPPAAHPLPTPTTGAPLSRRRERVLCRCVARWGGTRTCTRCGAAPSQSWRVTGRGAQCRGRCWRGTRACV